MRRFELSSMLPVLALAAAPSLLAAHPARAGSVGVENGAYVEHVSSAGLDLSAPAGQEALRTRVRVAARDVCFADGGSVMSSLEMNRCIRDANRSAQASLAIVLDRPAGARTTLASR
jgi:UrcA family protein